MNITVKTLKPHQVFCIGLMFNLSSVLVFRGFIKSETLFWLCVLISGLIFNILFLFMVRQLRNRAETDLFSYIDNVCGRKSGGIIGGLLCLYAVFIATRVINSASSMVVNVSLDKTPQLIIIFLIGSISVYAITSGIDIFGKFSTISFILISLFLLIAFFIGFDNIEWKYVFTKSDLSVKAIVSDISSYFSYPFAEGIILLCLIFNSKDRKKAGSILSASAVVSTILVSLISLFCLSILGLPMLKTQYYTFYSTVSVINFGEVISRIEIIVSIILVLSLIVKYAICLYFVWSYIKRITPKLKEKYLYYILLIVTGVIAFFLGSRNYSLIKLFEYYKIWVWGFQLLIPAVIICSTIIKRKKALTD